MLANDANLSIDNIREKEIFIMDEDIDNTMNSAILPGDEVYYMEPLNFSLDKSCEFNLSSQFTTKEISIDEILSKSIISEVILPGDEVYYMEPLDISLSKSYELNLNSPSSIKEITIDEILSKSIISGDLLDIIKIQNFNH